MKKVLILTYSFPPCNLTASQRVKGWAEYLNLFGYYPVVITRNWDYEIKFPADVYVAAGNVLNVKQHGNYEVHYVPYKSNLNGRLFVKHGNNKLIWLRKVLTFKELVFQNYFLSTVPYNNMYDEARKVLINNPDIKNVVVTGNPYVLFKFGYLLKKEFKVNLIIDYRDDWTTDEIDGYKGFFRKIIWFLERKSELKWVGSADQITTVSEHYLTKILGLFPGKKGTVIYNGFWEEDATKFINRIDSKQFTITFNGTLYETQAIEIFVQGILRVIDRYKYKLKIVIKFPGLAYNALQEERVNKLVKGYEEHFEITGRIPREQVLEMQSNSNLLLMVAHKGILGVPSSKLFEYVGLRKPILVCPGDGDIIDKIVTETGLGLICNNEEALFNTICDKIEEVMSGGEIHLNLNEEKIAFYSRKNQVKKLAEALI